MKEIIQKDSDHIPDVGEKVTLSIRLVRDFKAANLSLAMNLIKGSSNNMALNPH